MEKLEILKIVENGKKNQNYHSNRLVKTKIDCISSVNDISIIIEAANLLL